MKRYLAVFMGSPEAMQKYRELDEEMRKKNDQTGMQAWMQWGKDNEKSIVDWGAPLGKTKSIGQSGITDIKNEMGAYTVVEAESHEAAAKLFLNHPHFTLFPGDRVELMECLPMPEMPQ